MAVARTYNVDTGQTTGISIGTGGTPGTEYVLMYGATAGEFNISAVRVGTYSGVLGVVPVQRDDHVAAPPGVQHQAAPSSSGTGDGERRSASPPLLPRRRGSTPPPTGPVPRRSPRTANVLWSQTIPCTAGANWGEWFTPGFELNVTNSTIAVTYELGAAAPPPR